MTLRISRLGRGERNARWAARATCRASCPKPTPATSLATCRAASRRCSGGSMSTPGTCGPGRQAGARNPHAAHHHSFLAREPGVRGPIPQQRQGLHRPRPRRQRAAWRHPRPPWAPPPGSRKPSPTASASASIWRRWCAPRSDAYGGAFPARRFACRSPRRSRRDHRRSRSHRSDARQAGRQCRRFQRRWRHDLDCSARGRQSRAELSVANPGPPLPPETGNPAVRVAVAVAGRERQAPAFRPRRSTSCG